MGVRGFLLLPAVLASAWALAQPAAVPVSVAEQRVIAALDKKDCAAAASELNAGLAAPTSGLLLLAGAMFEEGLCLKPSWERAARLYERAADAGSGTARARLAAGHAAPSGGPDRAAALWWAQQTRIELPAGCRVADADRKDPDRFVARLREWPAPQLDACVYVAGVLAAVAADVDGARGAEVKGLSSAVTLVFVPATPRIDVNMPELRLESVYNDPTQQGAYDLQVKIAQRNLVKQVEAAADRALKRYPKPPSIDAGWRVGLGFDGGRGG